MGKPVNILDYDITFPETVYIVGTAPEDESVYRAIPDGAFVIVVNGAINCPVDAAIWMLSDPNVLNLEYFKTNIEYIRNSGWDIYPSGIKAGGPVVPVVDEASIWPSFKWLKTIYKGMRGQGMTEAGGFHKEDGTLRAGATIAGAAVQLVLYMGGRIIKLVGIKLHGDDYFDGSKHADSERADKEWGHKDVWDWLMHIMIDVEGMRITHLRDDIKSGSHVVRQPNKEMIFESGLELPARVIILAPGPNGKGHWNKIKPDDYVIAVNGAIAIESVNPDMWICADGHTTECDYFKPGCERAASHNILKVWSGAVRDRAGKYKPDLNFRMREDHQPGFRLVPDMVRTDATVAGIAIDIAYRRGAKFIDLCGVDMSGDQYFDGTDAPANCDDRHGFVWDSRNELDSEIRWMNNHGVRVSTMSETRLREPHSILDYDRPTVALLTMAFNPVYTKSAIFCAAIQDYPDHLKSLYLITQNGEQPYVYNDLPFKIIQLDIEGKWPELWLMKLMRFFEHATEDYIAIFDEDDYFEPGYISAGMYALKDESYKMVWTFKNKFVTRQNIIDGKYRSAAGTIIVERELAFEIARGLWRTVYDQRWESGIKPPGDYGVRGAQDMNYQHMLIEHLTGINVLSSMEFEFGEQIGRHDGVRWYRYHLNANTCSGRKDEECIDYWMPDLWYSGTRFEESRAAKREKKD